MTTFPTTHNFIDGGHPVPAHQHPNGGGWVANTAHVDESVYVGEDAGVFGNAQVSGNARILGNAMVHGDARVGGDARIDDDSVVAGNAQVGERARVSGNASVTENAQIFGDAQVYGDAWVHDNAQVSGNARIHEDADVYRDARVFGGELRGDASVGWGEFYDGVKFDEGDYGDQWDEIQKRTSLANSIIELYGDQGKDPNESSALSRSMEYTGTRSRNPSSRRGRGNVRY